LKAVLPDIRTPGTAETVKSPFKNLFENITWSSNSVFNETIKQIEKRNLTLFLLPILNDVDEEKHITFDY